MLGQQMMSYQLLQGMLQLSTKHKASIERALQDFMNIAAQVSQYLGSSYVSQICVVYFNQQSCCSAPFRQSKYDFLKFSLFFHNFDAKKKKNKFVKEGINRPFSEFKLLCTYANQKHFSF